MYRKDIDGLRAIAVLSVILFHLNILPNGYLGVDVFFVISGYLITKIIYKEAIEGDFSIIKFYLRRLRRIIPLVLLVNFISLIIGLLVMLPNDLENLGQSAVATNLFSNNVLEYMVSKDYWNILNEFKPLMHTWSLGVEEQYYLIYPVLFIILSGKRLRYVFPVIVVLTIISLILFITCSNESLKFYMLPYRFFELSIGGIGSLLFKDRITSKLKFPFLILMILILLLNTQLPASINLIFVVLATFFILITDNDKSSQLFIENKILLGIGKISFSLYMWHQLVFAYARYFVFDSIDIYKACFLIAIVFLLSIVSYNYIEQPFRDKNKISNFQLFVFIGFFFLLTSGIGLYLHINGGVIKEVPELNIEKSKPEKNTQVVFNMRIMDYLNKDFIQKNKIKVLIIGNSFSRDWANVLLSSRYSSQIELSYISISLSYIDEINKSGNLRDRWNKADYVYISVFDKFELDSILVKYKLDTTKYWVIGVKNFGVNNGIFYNKPKNNSYYNQRSLMAKGYIERNNQLKVQYKDKYIDIISQIISADKTVPVFTNDGKFFSQDCIHLTESGAKYFGQMVVFDKYFRFNEFKK